MKERIMKQTIFTGSLKATLIMLGVMALGVNTARAQDPNCQAGTGPIAGFATEAALQTAAGATPVVCGFDSTTNANAKTNIKHVLLMDWSNGQHSRVHTQKHMYRLARKYGFKLTRSQSNTYITPATLDGVDLIVFNNGDQDPLNANTTVLNSVRNFVETQGKSIMAVHAALAFIPCPNEDVTVANLTTCRWFLRAFRTQFWVHLNHATASSIRIYVDSVQIGQVPPNATGADVAPATVNHGISDSALMNIFATLPVLTPGEQLPFNGGTGPDAGSRRIWDGAWDEWYSYRNHPRRSPVGNFGGVEWGPVKMLLSIDESHSSYPNTLGCSSNSPCKTGDRPVSWTRTIGNAGLAAYNNAGHGDVYARARGGTQDSLWEKYNWRVLKYLARDYVGCTNPAAPNYNPQASVRSITPIDSTPGSAVYRGGDMTACPTVVSIMDKLPKGVNALEGVIASSNGLRVSIPAGNHELMIAQLNGRLVHTSSVTGGEHAFKDVNNLNKGYYIVRLETKGKSPSVAGVMVK
jgi:hypothetical protein